VPLFVIPVLIQVKDAVLTDMIRRRSRNPDLAQAGQQGREEADFKITKLHI
jgi:hypothetical protein